MGENTSRLHVIKKGLDLPIEGEPQGDVKPAGEVTKVAVVAEEFAGMSPRMHIQLGDVVKRGQLLFEDRKTAGVRFTAWGAGKVVGVNRGERRKLLSVVIDLDDSERSGDPSEMTYESFTGKPASELTGSEVRALMQEMGRWIALRSRPFDKVPAGDSESVPIFVTAIDTRPLSPSPEKVLAGKEGLFLEGLKALAKLAEGKPVYLCVAAGSSLNGDGIPGVSTHQFKGPHPAGLAGTHINLLDPVNLRKSAWHIGYQDVLALGSEVKTGKMYVNRCFSLAGPQVKAPGILQARQGAMVEPLIEGNLKSGENRVISGSVLFGLTAMGPVMGYLGLYTNQISIIAEDRERKFLGWLAPGSNIFSVMPLFLSWLTRRGMKMPFTTNTFGSMRSIVPFGVFEKVVPLDLMPTFLLRALLAKDLELADDLGVLELAEEDLSLCTFVCPGKNDYGPALRDMLTRIEKEG